MRSHKDLPEHLTHGPKKPEVKWNDRPSYSSYLFLVLALLSIYYWFK